MLTSSKSILFFSLLFWGICNAQEEGKVYGHISDQFGDLPGVQISISGTGVYTTSDLEGNYSLTIIPGDYILSVSFTTYKPIAKNIIVEANQELNIDFLLETGFSLNPSISIDSRSIRSTVLATSAPVEVVTAQDIANSSQVDLSQVLQYIVPSFHSARQTIADGTDHVDPASLRGLGPDQILILINGKRRHNSALLHVNGTVGRGTAGTDFNAIPISAIDRIEILRDGGASQYGADAIAGVINIILKRDAETSTIYSIASVNSEGDGFETLVGGNFGFTVGDKGYINLTAEYRNRETTNRSGDFTGRVFFDDPVLDAQRIEETNFFEQTGFSGQQIMEVGNAAAQNIGIAVNAEIPINETSKFYLFGLTNNRIGSSRGFYRLPIDQSRVVLELFPNGFSPIIEPDIDDYSVFGGFKTIKNGWNIDFSYGFGFNRIDFNISNSNNASLGISSPRNFFSGAYTYAQQTANIDFNKNFDVLEGLNFAFGGESRTETYAILAGEEASFIDGGDTFIDANGNEVPRIAGVQVFPGIMPENELRERRIINSFYYDIDTHLTKKFLVKFAGRIVTSDNIPNTFIWKLSSRYTINDNLGVRVGYSTGTRPPSLHQLFFQNIGTQFVSDGPAQTGTFNTQSPISESLGLGNLRPESSQYFSAGFDGKISENFNFSFNYYNIDISDRIVLSGRISEGIEDILEPLGVDIAQVFTNALDSETNGIDATFGYQTSLGRGRFNTTLTGNITSTNVKGNIRVPEALEGQEDTFFSREEIARVVSAQPRSKFISTVSYDIDKLKFSMQNTYFGSTLFIFPSDENPEDFVFNEFTGSNDSRDQHFTPKILTDISANYKINNGVSLTLGGNNIFNIFPDRINHSALAGEGRFIFSRRVQQFNVRGANFFARLHITL